MPPITDGRRDTMPKLVARLTVAALAVAAVVPLVGTEATAAPASPGLVEVGRLPIPPNDDAWANSAWLVLNPTTRRAYQISETSGTTYVESFDLDTLAHRRRVELAGIPIPTGRRNGHVSAGAATASAEVVHAFDQEAGILYLALGEPNAAQGTVADRSSSADARRPATRYVAIDERALDEGREAVASFREPATQAPLRFYWLHGMEVDRNRTTTTPSGKEVGTLVLLFAQPQNPNAPVHNHELLRWDVRNRLTPSAAARTSTVTAEFAEARDDGRRVLDVCRSSSLTPENGYNTGGSGSQWEMLVGRDEIHLVCHTGATAAVVARLGLEDDGGFPPAGAATVFPLGRGAYDAVADREGRKLFLRSTDSTGETWWVFDAGVGRFTGSLAAKVTGTGPMTTGIDTATGRFYALVADYTTTFGGKQRAVKGGLHFADTRLFDPVPFENVRPELAYPVFAAIRVDPATQRVFVRRGQVGGPCVTYPNTQATSQCPLEPYYRVLKDTIPVPQEQPEADDSRFTTDVAEAEGVTQASYLGTGSGYGVRAMFLGGLGRCGTDDRDVLAGSVGNVSVSDLSTAAEASSLDADLSPQKVAATPVRSCLHESAPATDEEDEASFDKRDNDEPEVKVPDGVNDYEASCTGDGSDSPPTVDGHVPRHGFSSEAVCDHRGARAEGRATGQFAPPGDVGGLRVAKGHSEVKVVRRQGVGITTTVDSWARGIVVPEEIGRAHV